MGHHYPIGIISLFLLLVGQRLMTFRGAERGLPLLCDFFHLSWPCPTRWAGRWWWLRLGYYKLTRKLPRGDDWVWIIDHSIQIGPEKCLLILGVRLRDLPSDNRCLSYEQVEPLTLYPVRQSTGEIVYQQLEETQPRTGPPTEILTDQGSDLRAGVGQYSRAHPTTRPVADIAHLAALLLKHELHNDASWQSFVHYATAIRHELQQTPQAALIPPNQRSKARYMNLEPLLRWGRQLIAWWEHPEPLADYGLDPEAMRARLWGLHHWKTPLDEWETLWQLAQTTVARVRHEGYFRGVEQVLEPQLALPYSTERTQRMRQSLLEGVAREGQKAHPDERLIGSSEIIESVFGALKALEGPYAGRGFTGLLLSAAAMVSTTTEEVIRNALETVPTKEVRQWLAEKLGTSFQAQRQAIFKSTPKAEQKSDQLSDVA
jgi:hypothetical protein